MKLPLSAPKLPIFLLVLMIALGLLWILPPPLPAVLLGIGGLYVIGMIIMLIIPHVSDLYRLYARYAPYFIVGSVAAFFLSAWFLRPNAATETTHYGYLAVGVGVLCLGLGLPKAPPIALPPPLSPSKSHLRWIAAGALSLAILAELNGRKTDINLLDVIPHTAQFGLLIFGIGALIWGFGWLTKIEFDSLRIWWKRDARAFLPLLLIFAMALALRLFQLDTSLRIQLMKQWSSTGSIIFDTLRMPD